MVSSDREPVQRLAAALWPYERGPFDVPDERTYVGEGADGTLCGFVTFSVRERVDGAESEPCPHVEGWYVVPDARESGVGRSLISAVETWCREHGFGELTSDTELANTVSRRAHEALGFEPTEQLQYFRKRLSC